MLIDVAVHVGTLAAVMIYFWRDLWTISVGTARLAIGRGGAGARLAGYILVATSPVVIVGFFGRDYIAVYLRDIEIIAWATIGFGIILWVSDHVGMTVRRVEHLSLWDAFMVGRKSWHSYRDKPFGDHHDGWPVPRFGTCRAARFSFYCPFPQFWEPVCSEAWSGARAPLFSLA